MALARRNSEFEIFFFNSNLFALGLFAAVRDFCLPEEHSTGFQLIGWKCSQNSFVGGLAIDRLQIDCPVKSHICQCRDGGWFFKSQRGQVRRITESIAVHSGDRNGGLLSVYCGQFFQNGIGCDPRRAIEYGSRVCFTVDSIEYTVLINEILALGKPVELIGQEVCLPVSGGQVYGFCKGYAAAAHVCQRRNCLRA